MIKYANFLVWSLVFSFLAIAQSVSKLIHKQKVMKTALSYYFQRSSVDDQKIDYFFISMGVMSYTMWWLPRKGMVSIIGKGKGSRNVSQSKEKLSKEKNIVLFAVDFVTIKQLC